MSTSPTRILKGALWIQAALLLVLTSILADSDAWIGAIITGVGFFLVIIGIAAAHKQRIGYLYCYATLVGLWEMLALTHVLAICGLIVLPPTLVNAAYVIGQRVMDNPSDAMKIVLPVLYGLQWCAWCTILLCLVSLRLAARDMTMMGLEIHEPKRLHSIERSRSQSSHNSNSRMSQHLFNFRQSVISPVGGRGGTSSGAGSMTNRSGVLPFTARPGSSGEGPSGSRTYKGKEPINRRYCDESDMRRVSDRAWMGVEGASSTDSSNAIYIPNDPRISQVVVMFRDNGKEDQQQGSSSQQRSRSLRVSRLQGSLAIEDHQPSRPETKALFSADHNHDVGAAAGVRSSGSNTRTGGMFVLNISPSGESLSEMIFNPSQTVDQPPPPPTMTTLDSAQPSGQESGAQDGADLDTGMNNVPNPARIRGTATKASLTLSSDSSSSGLSALSQGTSSDSDELEQRLAAATLKATTEMSDSAAGQDTVITSLAMVSATPLNIVSKAAKTKRKESKDTDTTTKAADSRPAMDQETRSIPSCNEIQEVPIDLQSSHPQNFVVDDGTADDLDELVPQTQPNSSDSSPSLSSLSSLPMSPRRPSFHEYRPWRPNDSAGAAMELSHEDDIEVAELLQTPITSKVHPVSESSLASIASSPPGSNPMSSAATSPSAYRSKPSLVSLPLQYWRSLSNTQPLFHRADSPVSYAPSFTQSYLSNTFSKKKKLNIPTIVIHPDEEDGEPPRVLSQKDIDYLSTMPPPPLRLLIQPWDDLSEEEEYDDMDNTEYGPDDCHPDHHESHHHHHHHHDLEKDQEHAEEEEEDDMELTGTACMGMISIGDRGFDPYALDVPIELDVDIQELTRNNASSTTKYRVTER